MTPTGEEDANVVQLCPNRGPGLFYGVFALVVAVVVLAAVGANLASGHLLAAAVTLVVGGGIAAFLTLLSVAILGPSFEFGPDGVTGRTSFRRPIDLAWPDVTLDVPDESPPGQLQLGVAGETYSLDQKTWAGFRDFVILVASTPGATARLSPGARDEVSRMLGISHDPGRGEPDPGI